MIAWFVSTVAHGLVRAQLTRTPLAKCQVGNLSGVTWDPKKSTAGFIFLENFMVAAASAKSPTLACFASVGFKFIEQSLKYVTT